jgi:hypothetical protein
MNKTSIETEPAAVKNPVMTLITKEQRKALIKAGYNNMRPIVKIFGGAFTWLITGEEDGILYGYADLSMDCIEWGGLFSVEELATMKYSCFYFERDLHFEDDPKVEYLKLDTLSGI